MAFVSFDFVFFDFFTLNHFLISAFRCTSLDAFKVKIKLWDNGWCYLKANSLNYGREENKEMENIFSLL